MTPRLYAQSMRERFERVVLASNKSRLAAARAGAALSRAETTNGSKKPTDIATARERLARAFEETKRSISLAARNESQMSEAELVGMAEDLNALEASSLHASRSWASGIRPDALLKALGVTEPEEIDLEAIAFSVHAKIQYRVLEGCDARIVGYGNDSIITVNRKLQTALPVFGSAWRSVIGCFIVEGSWHARWKKIQPLDQSIERDADRFAADPSHAS